MWSILLSITTSSNYRIAGSTAPFVATIGLGLAALPLPPSLTSHRGSPCIPPQLEQYLSSSPPSSEEIIHTLLGSDILYASECYTQLESTLLALRFQQLIIAYKRRHDEYDLCRVIPLSNCVTEERKSSSSGWSSPMIYRYGG
jgi:hypothetical protein